MFSMRNYCHVIEYPVDADVPEANIGMVYSKLGYLEPTLGRLGNKPGEIENLDAGP